MTISHDFFISYKDNSFASGDYLTDTVQIAGVTLNNVQFALASTSSNPGILGLGYPKKQVAAHHGYSYEDFLDILIREKLIKAKAFSIWMETQEEGRLLLGGYDKTKYFGQLSTIAIIPTILGGRDLGIIDFAINLNSIEFLQGDQSIHLPSMEKYVPIQVILDTGSSGTYFPKAVVKEILSILKITRYSSEGDPRIDCNLAPSKMTMNFVFAAVTIPVPVTSLFQPIGTGADGCQINFYPSDDDVYQLGVNFLKSVYTVFDMTNNQVSMALTKPGGSTDSDIVEIINYAGINPEDDDFAESGSDDSGDIENLTTNPVSSTGFPLTPTEEESQAIPSDASAQNPDSDTNGDPNLFFNPAARRKRANRMMERRENVM